MVLDKKPLSVFVADVTGPDLLDRAMEAGANGFLLKENTFDELMTALKTVGQGGTYVSPAIASRLPAGEATGIANKSRLTARELEVLKRISFLQLTPLSLLEELNSGL